MAHEKEIVVKFIDHLCDKYEMLNKSGLLEEAKSFLATLPEEKEEKPENCKWHRNPAPILFDCEISSEPHICSGINCGAFNPSKQSS